MGFSGRDMFAYKPEMVVDDDDAEETLDREVEEDAYEGEIYEVKNKDVTHVQEFSQLQMCRQNLAFFALSH